MANLINRTLRCLPLGPMAVGTTAYTAACILAGNRKQGGFVGGRANANLFIYKTDYDELIADIKRMVIENGMLPPSFTVNNPKFNVKVKYKGNAWPIELCNAELYDAPGGMVNNLSRFRDPTTSLNPEVFNVTESVYPLIMAFVSLRELSNTSNCSEFNSECCSQIHAMSCATYKRLSQSNLLYTAENCEYFNKFSVRLRLERLYKRSNGENMIVVVTNGANRMLENNQNGSLQEQVNRAKTLLNAYLSDICKGNFKPPIFVIDSVEALNGKSRSPWLDDIAAPFMYGLKKCLTQSQINTQDGVKGAFEKIAYGSNETKYTQAISIVSSFLESR